MTEHTDKPAQKPDRTPPRKRAGKAPSPAGKRATAPSKGPGGKAASGNAEGGNARGGQVTPPALPAATAGGDAARSPLAPDPATVVFGTNRPIAAPPVKLPESSGLRFSGPSAGILKASGPQPTLPKASGLTFTSAKPATSAKPTPAKTDPVKPAAKPAAKKPEPKKQENGKPEAEKPTLTKPAIAPQASARHFDKERSTNGFVLMMLALTILGGGLAFWMKLSGEAAAPQQVASTQAEPTTPVAPVTTEPVVVLGPSMRAPMSPGPLVGDGALSAAEVGEIQDLLRLLDFDPGSEHGMLSTTTTAAIRSYQEMAGLPADGEADRALLEELRSVAELYGS